MALITVPLVFIALIVVDIAVFASILTQYHGLLLAPNIDNIEFRSQYVGLDFLYTQNDTRPLRYDPIANDPILAAQINSSELYSPAKVDSHDDAHALALTMESHQKRLSRALTATHTRPPFIHITPRSCPSPCPNNTALHAFPVHLDTHIRN
jgi:hypothetical protein